MGIALLAFVDILSPLQALAGRWIAPRRQARRSELRYVAIRPSCGARNPASPAAEAEAHKVRPLRVVRLVDGQAQARARAGGRLVISGRMADVCAELDRLAALESGAAEAPARGAH